MSGQNQDPRTIRTILNFKANDKSNGDDGKSPFVAYLDGLIVFPHDHSPLKIRKPGAYAVEVELVDDQRFAHAKALVGDPLDEVIAPFEAMFGDESPVKPHSGLIDALEVPREIWADLVAQKALASGAAARSQSAEA